MTPDYRGKVTLVAEETCPLFRGNLPVDLRTLAQDALDSLDLLKKRPALTWNP